MSLFKIDVWIPVNETQALSRTAYYIEAEDVDSAKKRALEMYRENVFPNIVVVSWEGPLSIEKVEAAVQIVTEMPASNP